MSLCRTRALYSYCRCFKATYLSDLVHKITKRNNLNNQTLNGSYQFYILNTIRPILGEICIKYFHIACFFWLLVTNPVFGVNQVKHVFVLHVAIARVVQSQHPMTLCSLGSVKIPTMRFVCSSNDCSAHAQSSPKVQKLCFCDLWTIFSHLHSYSHKHANAENDNCLFFKKCVLPTWELGCSSAHTRRSCVEIDMQRVKLLLSWETDCTWVYSKY